MLLPPVVLLVVAAAAQGMIPARHPRAAGSVAAASVVAAASAALATDALLRFHRHGTTVDPLRPTAAERLVTDGANALTRNPMYVAMAGALLAHAVVRRSPAAVLPAAAFVVVLDRGQIAVEEAALADRFAATYETYREQVPRWVDRRTATTALAAAPRLVGRGVRRLGVRAGAAPPG
ncbi:methyltransferase family protein [Cellulomonas endophytica]|uniref:methyltransferase family protein n=1 Tax=Cellulomonas endophytica TaxID=2494735 RepID=UPI00196ACC49|nr:isoprenylcysteine carboxylmethyltransferase family protein [Cellulomonas endophytica]